MFVLIINKLSYTNLFLEMENGFHKVKSSFQHCFWHASQFHLIILGIIHTGKVKGKGEK